MLVFERKVGQEIVIEGIITIKVLEPRRGNMRLGIDAPRHIKVNRKEVEEREDGKPNT
jgi:carbon storage regulator